MRNIKISRKILISFLVVIALFSAVTIIGLTGMHAIQRSVLEIYEEFDIPFYYVENAMDTASTFESITIVFFVITVIFSLLVTKKLSDLIAKPLQILDKLMLRTANNGDIGFKADELKYLKEFKGVKDEIGDLFGAYVAIIDSFNEVCEELRMVADGNLSFEITPRSKYDLLTITLKNMAEDLNVVISHIKDASIKTADGAQCMASSSKEIAEVASDNAVAIDDVSEVITEFRELVGKDQANITRALNLADEVMKNAEVGALQMSEMTGAVNEIEQAGRKIVEVIKVIEEIAFQTNILALNAAVEAARAGQHGKGFAVVADEVRSLATKSSEAAKNSNQLILNSMEKTELGVHIATQTAENFGTIVSSISENNRVIHEISDSVYEQITIFDRVSRDIEQIAESTRRSTSVAEESANIAEDLSNQSGKMLVTAAGFKLKKL